MRPKNTEQKFTGYLGECWHDYFDEYNEIASDYNLHDEKQLRFMHSHLTNDSHRFFLDKVMPFATLYASAVDIIDKEYNSILRQMRAENDLENLRHKGYIGDDKKIAAALTRVYERILILSLQAPEAHRGDPHNIELLKSAVIGHQWSIEPLSIVATSNLSYQQLYAELEIVELLYKENSAAQIHERIITALSFSPTISNDIPAAPTAPTNMINVAV